LPLKDFCRLSTSMAVVITMSCLVEVVRCRWLPDGGLTGEERCYGPFIYTHDISQYSHRQPRCEATQAFRESYGDRDGVGSVKRAVTTGRH
jgi:hypothetical protein